MTFSIYQNSRSLNKQFLSFKFKDFPPIFFLSDILILYFREISLINFITSKHKLRRRKCFKNNVNFHGNPFASQDSIFSFTLF